MASRHGHRIDADFTEDVVGFALESFLTLLSFPRRRFSIEPFSRQKERWLGADARLHAAIGGFRPFYMQFKRPSAYPDYSRARVIKDRTKLRLDASPRALFFSLREKQPHHRDFQHNVLFRLRRHLHSRSLGDAAYVCPLFLDRSAYRQSLHWSGLYAWPRFWRHYPWDLEEVLIDNGGSQIRFDRVPVLAEHITVPPHVAVTTAKHSYSFSESGAGLCFHSPEALPDGSADLATFLARLSAGFLERDEVLSPETADQALNDLIGAVYERPASDAGISGEDPIGRWLAWGDRLRREEGIEQYALVQWDKKSGAGS